jgi:hypothetical protein
VGGENLLPCAGQQVVAHAVEAAGKKPLLLHVISIPILPLFPRLRKVTVRDLNHPVEKGKALEIMRLYMRWRAPATILRWCIMCLYHSRHRFQAGTYNKTVLDEEEEAECRLGPSRDTSAS